MAFEEVEIIGDMKSSSDGTGLSLGLAKLKLSNAKMKITIRQNVWETLGFDMSDRFALLVGRDDDFGMIRLQKNKAGKIKPVERVFLGNSRYVQFSLGHRPEFVNRTEKAVQCQWEKIDFTTFEIVLPSWADETNPKGKVRIQSLPPALVANKKEMERQAREAREADARRHEQELKEVADEARRQFGLAMSMTVKPYRQDMAISNSERSLLDVLVTRKGQIVSRENIMTLVYGMQGDPPSDKIIDVHLSRIRSKLPVTVQIATVHGQGFKLTGNVDDLFEKVA